MSDTFYRRGYRFEQRVKKYLESQSWYVIASRGSHGVADLIAGRAGETLLIQCKTDGVMSSKERLQLKEVAAEFGGVPVVAHRDGRKLVMELAVGEELIFKTSAEVVNGHD